MQIEIKYLQDCQEHIPALGKLWYEEISRHWFSDASIENRTGELLKHINKDTLPLSIVAFINNQPVGMACLRKDDGLGATMTPWLGSLIVNPEFRQRKIGEALINKIMAIAKSFGHNKLYLLALDPTIPNWYAKLGWEHIGYDELSGHRVTVMKCNLS